MSPEPIPDGTFALYRVSPGSEGVAYELAGRFRVLAGVVEVLEDAYGHLAEVGGQLTPRTRAILEALARASYYSIGRED